MSYISFGSHNFSRPGAINSLGLTEVDQFYQWGLLSPRQQDVVNSNSPVGYQIFVTIFDDRKYLPHDFYDMLKVNPLVALMEFLENAVALDFLEDDIEERRFEKVFDNLHSVGMV